METETDEGTPTTSPTDAPFIPPAGVCDVGDIVRHGKDELMVLGSDQKWHEGEGPSDFEVKFSKYEKADLFRLNDHLSGYKKQLKTRKCYTGYRRWDEDLLDAEFDKYRIQHENEKTLERFLGTMKQGKVFSMKTKKHSRKHLKNIWRLQRQGR
ncbi:hypothetical protein sscle_10g079670 [Sclerotinia sclerotiorum 1980 UF-70]|uniref:Uncharacterized protein n=1 Tax=Sclerotinia sclerotiorum (strain ATCC 18683 / 1980 / Ss-1) TaxID=665079 RepID=A0A1D9QE34_SCLS1|nr:hypothetical protein sscle_10g079670 [Sclerotinia sclerotiorum 1980 UF-70]